MSDKSHFYTKENGKITNSEYQMINNVSKATSTRDLTELVVKYKLLERIEEIGVVNN